MLFRSRKTGLDIRSISSSLKVRISNVGNDYSYLEENYKYITGQELLTTKSDNKNKFKINNISIIIPVYNQDVTYTLLSIQGQNITKEEKKKILLISVKKSALNNAENVIRV